jgi:hypothetical protein
MATTPLPDITLYGTAATGAGWLALLPPHGRVLGTGEPRADRSFTQAVWGAALVLQDAGYRGPARVFEPGGTRVAVVEVGGPIPWYGDLQWEAL